MNREEFPMLNTNYIYLDNGATTWKPKYVVDKINEYTLSILQMLIEVTMIYL